MPKVSVVIPAHNAMAYLPETLENVLQQTFTDFEVLIVNDGSSDNIVSWATGICDTRVKLISQPNQGISATRNTGIALTTGDYIAFLDADDLWEPTKLAKQVSYLDCHPQVGLVYTGMLFIDERSYSTGRIIQSKVEGNVLDKVLLSNPIPCSSVMIRRQCFAEVGVFDRNLRSIEDWDMWIRIAARYPLGVIPEALMYYRQVPNSLSKNYQAMEKAFVTVIEKAFSKIAPPELLNLKSRSYGDAYLCLAWKSLQSKDRNYQQAAKYRRQAIESNSQLRFSPEFMRLSLAIAIMSFLGVAGYKKILEILYFLRRKIFFVL
ncbi:glycosyltransferase family 2 protein [Calothrix sp. 336/3]|uniref:glycosyltransferase family 2 protein n=1 Tax=Calothrix sp. 336/3 TaxID=1337936 RepID=UPI0004E3FB80|nr:glycosyltransferase [Calothrix sp. 336/3]AKG21003.1 glycosyl transferase family A [Calothrix sp. 336/3]